MPATKEKLEAIDLIRAVERAQHKAKKHQRELAEIMTVFGRARETLRRQNLRSYTPPKKSRPKKAVKARKTTRAQVTHPQPEQVAA